MSAFRELRKLWLRQKAEKEDTMPDLEVGVINHNNSSGNIEENNMTRPGLPLLQVWPSQDSPAHAASRSFIISRDTHLHTHDSGIDSTQASPRDLLRPEDPRHYPSTPLSTATSSASESRRSSSHAPPSTCYTADGRRRSTRYSLLDALDLEYALLRAAARGSLGPCSLNGSVNKLTFTQSLAFPGLAKVRPQIPKSRCRSISRQSPPSGLNAFAKIVTALVLMLVSLMVFGVVYKFVRT